MDNQTYINEFNRQLDEVHRKFGKAVRLYYPPTFSSCLNCSEIANKPTVRGIPGSPIPLHRAVNNCINCGGTGKIASEPSETVFMAIHRNENIIQRIKTKLLGQTIEIPDNAIITVCAIKYILNIYKCNYILIDEDVHKTRYKRMFDPFPHGLGTKDWCLCFWDQIS